MVIANGAHARIWFRPVRSPPIMSHAAQPPDDKLTRSLFHKTMVFFYQPAGWPFWAVLLAALALSAGAGGVWWALSGSRPIGGLSALLLAVFIAADAWLLAGLPRHGLSFGSWSGQLFPLAILRLVGMWGCAMVGLLLGWQTALALALTTQLAGSAALIWGAVVEPSRLTMSTLTVEAPTLPPGSPPVRLLHISDIHLERQGVREQRMLDLAAAAEADVILISGDYVNLSNNDDPVTHAGVIELLKQLEAPGGVFAVLGSPPVDLPEKVAPLFDGLNVTLLREEAVMINLGDGRCLSLIGLDCHHDIPYDGQRMARLVATTPDDKPRILLYHSPELMPDARTHEVDLYLCGHTHGGQVRLPLIGPLLTSSQLGRRYVMGHYHEARTHLYVSRGVGFEGLSAPRLRFLCPPEILLVTLVPPAATA